MFYDMLLHPVNAVTDMQTNLLHAFCVVQRKAWHNTEILVLFVLNIVTGQVYAVFKIRNTNTLIFSATT